MAAATPPADEQHEKLYNIIKGARIAFMVTRSPSPSMRGRPMATAEISPDLTELWFATQRSSEVAAELQADGNVFLGYTNASGSEWAGISGHAVVVSDRAKAKELWNAFWKNWFTGPEDPELVLLKVTPEQGEFWDEGSRLWQLAKFAMTAVTGKKVGEGEHAEVSL